MSQVLTYLPPASTSSISPSTGPARLVQSRTPSAAQPSWDSYRLVGQAENGASSASGASVNVAPGLPDPSSMSNGFPSYQEFHASRQQQQQQQQQHRPSPPEPYRCEFPPPLAPRHWTVLKEVGDGSFGTVWLADWHSALNLPPGTQPPGPSSRPEYRGKQLVAIKRMKKAFDGGWDECMKLKELKSLRDIPMHPNLIPLYDAFLLPSSRELYFVFECMEGNLYQLTKSRKGRPLAAGLIASIFYQILSGLHHMHLHAYFHRDLKPENLLITTTGLADYPASALYALPGSLSEKDVVVVVKLADFGLAREIASKPPYTEYVSTRWYRAPEVLLRSRDYSVPVDMWAVGTIMVEVLTLKPLFPGDSEIDQVFKICEVLGDPGTDYGKDDRGRTNGGGTWARGVKMATAVGFSFPKVPPRNLAALFDLNVVSPQMIDCITDLLRYEPKARLTTQQCLEHPYFRDVAPRFTPTAPPQTHQQLPTPAPSNSSLYGSNMSIRTSGLANAPSLASPRSIPPSHSHSSSSHPASFQVQQAMPPAGRAFSISSAASNGSGLSSYPVQIHPTGAANEQVPSLGFPSSAASAPNGTWNGQGPAGWGQLGGAGGEAGGLRPIQQMPMGRRPSLAPSLAPSMAPSTYYDGSIYEGHASSSRAASVMSFPNSYGGGVSPPLPDHSPASFAPSVHSPSHFSALSPQQSRVDSIASGPPVAGPSNGLGVSYSSHHQQHRAPPPPDQVAGSPQSSKSISRWASANPLKRSPSNASIAASSSTPSTTHEDPKKAKKEAERMAKEQEKAARIAKEQAARERARAVMKKKNTLMEASDPLHNSSNQGRGAGGGGGVAGGPPMPLPLDKGKGRAPPSAQQRMPQIIEDTGRLHLSPGGMASVASFESGTGSFLANRFKARRRAEDDDVHSMSSNETGHSSVNWPFPVASRGRTFSISSKATSASDPERRQHRGPDFPVTQMDPLGRVSSISSFASGARTGGGGPSSLNRFPTYGHYTAPSTGHSSLDPGFIGGMQGLATHSHSEPPPHLSPYPSSVRSESHSRQRLASPHHERYSPYTLPSPHAPRSPGPTLPPISSFDHAQQQHLRKASTAASIASFHSQPGVMPSYFVQPPGGGDQGGGGSGGGGIGGGGGAEGKYHLPHLPAMMDDDDDDDSEMSQQHPQGYVGNGNGELSSPLSATFPYPSPSLSQSGAAMQEQYQQQQQSQRGSFLSPG